MFHPLSNYDLARLEHAERLRVAARHRTISVVRQSAHSRRRTAARWSDRWRARWARRAAGRMQPVDAMPIGMVCAACCGPTAVPLEPRTRAPLADAGIDVVRGLTRLSRPPDRR